jgi:diguanylate cyclase (GGDEF)-like protein
MTEKSTVVLVDFDRKRLDRHTQALTEAGLKVVRAQSGATAFEHCRKSKPFIVVAEAMIPDGSGFELARRLRAAEDTEDVKIVLTIDEGDPYTLSRAEMAGLDGVLIRPFTPEALVARVRALQAEESLAPPRAARGPELAPILDALESRARAENPLLPQLTDAITGLWNAHYTTLKLGEEFKKARRFNVPLACVVLALDDSPWEAGGDDDARRQILSEVAGLLLCESRDIDHLARTEGERFLLLLPHTDEHGAVAMMTRVVAAIEKRQFLPPGRTRPLTASAGIAGFSAEGLTGPDDLVARATDALNRARRFGGNRVETWTKEAERAGR